MCLSYNFWSEFITFSKSDYIYSKTKYTSSNSSESGFIISIKPMILGCYKNTILLLIILIKIKKFKL